MCRLEGAAREDAEWDGGQVSGARSAGGDLFAGDVVAGRCATGDGVFVQLEPAECSDIEGDDNSHFGRKSQTLRAGMPNAAADATGKCVLRLPGNGYYS